MKQAFLVGTLIMLVVVRIWLSAKVSSDNEYPNRPIRIVVPYLAGGGTDTFARILQKSLNENDFLGVPVVIENRDGGSATIGSRFVKDSKPDGYRILCHHEGLIATQLAGVVPYGPEEFRPVAQTGSIVLLMIVRADSPYQSLPDLLAAAQQEPDKIRMGANQGSPAYFICKRLLDEYPGANFNFVSASGSKRITYILGGKLEAGIFSLAEYLSFRKDNSAALDDNIVAIANFGESRNPAIADVKTSREQGLKTSASNAYYIWAPKDIPDEIAETLATAFEKAMRDPKTLAELEKLALEPTFRKGEELQQHLTKRVGDFEKLAVEVKNPLPNLVGWFVGITVTLFVLMIVLPKPKTDAEEDGERNISTAAARTVCGSVVVLYLLLLQFGIPFWCLTPIVMVVVSNAIQNRSSQGDTGLETESKRKSPFRYVNHLLISLVFVLIVEYLFTQIFFVPLA